MFSSLIRRMNHQGSRPRRQQVDSGVSRRLRSCCDPVMERLEELVLLSSAPVVNLGSAGGAGGVSLVKDILPGTAASIPTSLVNAGGRLFFLAVAPNVLRNQLWV